MPICEYCNKEINNEYNLYQHIISNHEILDNAEKECIKCKKSLNIKENFYHNQNGGYKNTCKKCYKSSVKQLNPVIKCDNCNKSVSYKNLAMHKRTNKCKNTRIP